MVQRYADTFYWSLKLAVAIVIVIICRGDCLSWGFGGISKTFPCIAASGFLLWKPWMGTLSPDSGNDVDSNSSKDAAVAWFCLPV